MPSQDTPPLTRDSRSHSGDSRSRSGTSDARTRAGDAHTHSGAGDSRSSHSEDTPAALLQAILSDDASAAEFLSAILPEGMRAIPDVAGSAAFLRGLLAEDADAAEVVVAAAGAQDAAEAFLRAALPEYAPDVSPLVRPQPPTSSADANTMVDSEDAGSDCDMPDLETVYDTSDEEGYPSIYRREY